MNNYREIIETLVQIFAEIPFEVWKEIVRNEPEWKNMEKFLDLYGFGPFSVLMVATGINDYQLKGEAEKVYWPKIKNILDEAPIPSTPADLCQTLEKFYAHERLHNEKIERLHKFLSSELAAKMWNSSPDDISKEFLFIWKKLATVMQQKKEAKTIVFAVKCLGISLFMANNYDFDFSPIPIPVDLRVAKLTEKLLNKVLNDDEIMEFWNEILRKIQEKGKRINMIHLDSLIWQLAKLDKDKIHEYFKNLKMEAIGDKLTQILDI